MFKPAYNFTDKLNYHSRELADIIDRLVTQIEFLDEQFDKQEAEHLEEIKKLNSTITELEDQITDLESPIEQA